MNDWLDTVFKETEEAECPKSFIFWSALSAISAVMNRKVWIRRGKIRKTYLNTYTILVGTSGLVKSYPINVSKRLVNEVNNTRVISGRASFQSIIHNVSQVKQLPQGGMIKDAICYIVSGEMSTSLVRDPDALTLLTDLYDTDYHEIWINSLKSSGNEELHKPCFTLLGGMNPTHFSDIISTKEITGGFIARCTLVLEKHRSKKNPMIDDDAGDDIDYKILAEPLREMSYLNGQMILTDDAKKMFKNWYSGWEPEELEDKTGTAFRTAETVVKTAGLLAIARTKKLVLEAEHMEEAFNLILKSSSVDEVTRGQGVDKEYSKKLSLFLRDVATAPNYTIERQKLLTRRYGDFDKWDLDRMVEHVKAAGGLEILYEGNYQLEAYRFTQKSIDAHEAGQRRAGFKAVK